ncbi:hypothetical protein CCP3SC1_220007 [Gammaproteobacteria bacterium]
MAKVLFLSRNNDIPARPTHSNMSLWWWRRYCRCVWVGSFLFIREAYEERTASFVRVISNRQQLSQSCTPNPGNIRRVEIGVKVDNANDAVRSSPHPTQAASPIHKGEYHRKTVCGETTRMGLQDTW